MLPGLPKLENRKRKSGREKEKKENPKMGEKETKKIRRIYKEKMEMSSRKGGNRKLKSWENNFRK